MTNLELAHACGAHVGPTFSLGGKLMIGFTPEQLDMLVDRVRAEENEQGPGHCPIFDRTMNFLSGRWLRRAPVNNTLHLAISHAIATEEKYGDPHGIAAVLRKGLDAKPSPQPWEFPK